MQNKLWYNVVMPANAEKKDQPLALRVPATLLDTLTNLAEIEDRPLGYVARELMIRGLALYRRDGKLRDEGMPSGVFVGKLSDAKAKIAAHPSGKHEVQRMIDEAEIAPRKRKAR